MNSWVDEEINALNTGTETAAARADRERHEERERQFAAERVNPAAPPSTFATHGERIERNRGIVQGQVDEIAEIQRQNPGMTWNEAMNQRIENQRNAINGIQHNAGRQEQRFGGTTEGYKANNVLRNRRSPNPQSAPRVNTVRDIRTQKIQSDSIDNSIPNWWDYMKQTSGGKGGAITRMASGVLQGLGNSMMGFAHGASEGKTPAPPGVKGDPFGLQGYGKLQNDYIQLQQEGNANANKINQNEIANDNAFYRSETSNDNQQIRDERTLALNQNFYERMQDKGFRDNIDMLIQNFEHSKELLGLTETQHKAMQQFAANLKAGELVRAYNDLMNSGITIDQAADFVSRIQGNRLLDDIFQGIGVGASAISSFVPGRAKGGYTGEKFTARFTGHGDRNEVAGIVHKGEYVIPKVGVDQITEKPKPSFYKFLDDPNVSTEQKTKNPEKHYSDWAKNKLPTWKPKPFWHKDREPSTLTREQKLARLKKWGSI